MILETFSIFLNRIMFFTSFVNNVNGFPQPLSAEEEHETLIKMKNGDNDAREKLINHNLRLVAHIVKKYPNAGEADDLISVGIIGLIKAINSYDFNKNTQLSTYASRCIENEILMLIRTSKRHNMVYSLEESLGTDKEGNDITLGDIIPNDDTPIDEMIENKILIEEINNEMKNSLTDREYKILCMRFGLDNSEPMTQFEVAKVLGISRSYISRIETKALGTLKKKMTTKNIKKQ